MTSPSDPCAATAGDDNLRCNGCMAQAPLVPFDDVLVHALAHLPHRLACGSSVLSSAEESIAARLPTENLANEQAAPNRLRGYSGGEVASFLVARDVGGLTMIKL